MKSWLEKNDIEIYSTHNEGKSVVAERFIRTLKYKIYKYITSLSKNVYFDKLDDIVNKYNNTCSTSKMKPADVKSNSYIDYSKEINHKDPRFKVDGIARMSKHNNIFANVTFEIGLKKFTQLMKLKIMWRGHMLLMILTQ